VLYSDGQDSVKKGEKEGNERRAEGEVSKGIRKEERREKKSAKEKG
jgi:hypothetical protein